MSWLFDAIPVGETVEIFSELPKEKEPKLLTSIEDTGVRIYSHIWPQYEERMEAIRIDFEFEMEFESELRLVPIR